MTSPTIGRDRLDHSASNRLEDVLRDVPGFQQFRRSDARSANPTSQGATLRALGGNASSRALLILDGVPQTDPFGGWISWPAYDPRRLGRDPGRARRRQRRRRPGRARRHDRAGKRRAGRRRRPRRRPRLRQPRQHRRLRRLWRARSATASSASRPPMRAATASFRSSRAQRGAGRPRPRPTARRASPLRAVAPLVRRRSSCRPIVSGLHRRARARHRVQRDRHARRRRLAAAGRPGPPALLGARLCPGPRLRQPASPRSSADRAAATPDARPIFACPRPGSARASRSGRVTGPVELRLGADWRETEGRTQELFQFVAGAPTRGRVAGGRTAHARRLRRGRLGARPADPHRRRRGSTIGGSPTARLRERMLATGAPLTDIAFPGPQRLGADRARRPRLARRRRR